MEQEKKEEKVHHKDVFHKKSPKVLSLGNLFIGLIILLGILVIINVFLTFNLNKETQKSVEAVKEKLKPAKVELVVLKNSRCIDCFDISTIISHVKNSNVNVTKLSTLEFDSKEGKAIIGRYKITKIPTIVVTGEIDNLNIQGLEKNGNALLLSKIAPPFTNALSGRIEGRVAVYYLKDPSCEKCSNLTTLINQIKSAGVKISEIKDIAPNSDDGKDLIAKYNLGFAPAIILSRDAYVYDIIAQAWPRIGSKESDGSYVLRLVNPPFINLTTGKLMGMASIIYLADKSCSTCYDVKLHRQILANPQTFAMVLEKEEAYDVQDSKGKELIAKYNITQVPTAILSDEVGIYPSAQVLRQFYSLEKDGSYIFRKLSVVGTYKDLTTNQVVQAQQQANQQQ